MIATNCFKWLSGSKYAMLSIGGFGNGVYLISAMCIDRFNQDSNYIYCSSFDSESTAVIKIEEQRKYCTNFVSGKFGENVS